MDVLYDNLENFTEEATNAELREENENLKIKLEEYAATLEQLQKEFDTLLSEHRKLELNYSSLLKTARSEIERKTKLITKLNTEKDVLVLNSIQNKNRHYNRSKPLINEPKNKEEPKFGNASQAQYKSDNSSKQSYLNQVPNERRDNYSNSTDLNNHHRNTHTTRNPEIVNKSVFNLNNTARTNAVKENVLKDEQKSRARISGRRKSMPVFGMDCSKFSSDEEGVASSGSSKEFVPQEPPDNRYPNKFLRDKPTMEHRTFGHYESKKDTRSCYSKYDGSKYRHQDNHDQFQKHKRNQSSDRKRRSPDRKKSHTYSSLERRRGSPDGNRKDIRDYSEEFYTRQEHDRHRRMASPPKDKYHEYKHRSRDSQHTNERYLMQEEKHKSRSQEKYTVKHKMMHDYEEPGNKRMRLDSFTKHEDDRWRVDRLAGPASLDIDPLNMSCQSPDQSHFEAQASHQTREIKLTASLQLDDPRLLSKKYFLKTHDGKAELSTVDSANIDVKLIDTSGWEINKTVKMPHALLTKPVSPDLPRESLLQRPMSSGMPGTSIQKPVITDSSSASLTKPKASEIHQNFIQKPKTTDTASETLQISPKIPDNQKVLSTNDSISLHKSEADMPDILSQKPISGDESVPDASTQKPMSNDNLVKEIYMDIDKPISNMSMETVSDVYDFDTDFHHLENNTIEKKSPEITKKHEVDKLKPTKPKITKKSSGDIVRIASSENYNSEKPNPKLKNKNIVSKTTNKKPNEDLGLNEGKLPPKRLSSELQNYISAKEIIAGDLELSDETSDNADTPIIKQNAISKTKQDSEMKDVVNSDNKDKPKTFELKFDFDDRSNKKVVHENVGENTDDIMLDIRKSRAKKKSLKLKETKEARGNKETPTSMNKPVEKQVAPQEISENTNTSLTLDELVQIKAKITNELTNQPTILRDKPIKTRENKSKTKVPIDKSVKNNETQPKGPLQNNDTESSMDKPGPVKKNDKKPKELPEKKVTATVEKPPKAKVLKTKEPVEPIIAIPIINNIEKTKSNIQESSGNIDKANMNKQVQNKDYEYKSKFNELFGDSSSLVSPEDLGILPTVVAPPENYIAMFEDAQDALDMNSIRATFTTAPTKSNNDTGSKEQSSFSINSDNSKPPVIPVEPTYQMQGPAHAESVPTNSSINQTIYQNLQPEFEQDSNIVKTVIISSGIQPQCTDATETYPIVSDNNDLHVMQCVKPTVLQDIALKALATSTPQKIWHQNVQVLEPSISETRCESREDSTTETPLAATCGISTNLAQTNATDEPDVTIFVKRRRKVLKKK